MNHAMSLVPDTGRRPWWRAVCTCGWTSKPQPMPDGAVMLGSSHLVREATV